MIAFFDLKAQYESIRRELEPVVLETLASTEYVLGGRVAAFERDFADYCGSRHAIAVNSGTSALHLSLLAAGVSPGDEVITVAFSFVATVATVLYAGARPVLCDVDERTMNIDSGAIESLVSERTKAIVPVHLQGGPAEMAPILALARRHGLMVIEDAAQAHGASYQGKRVGALGDMGCFSFYPSKNLGACGEGGLVVTDDDALAEKVRMLRDWGQDRKSHHALAGFNYRMEGIQGAVLGVKLRHLDDWIESRRRLAKRYDDALRGSGLTLPVELSEARHVYHLYAVRAPHRDDIRRFLSKRDIGTAIHYPIPIHLQPAYTELGYGKGSFPNAERAAEQILSLPLYPELAEESVEVVCRAVLEFGS